MTKSDNRSVLKKNTKYFVVKFITSLLIRFFLLMIPIYYSYGIDEITRGNYKVAYHMIILFFVFTLLYRLLEVVNQITYYNLYSNLYKTYLNLGFQKTCNNSIYSLSRFSLSEYSNIMSEDFETLSDYYATLVIRIVEILEAIYIVVYFFKIHILIGYLSFIVCFMVLFILVFFQEKIAKTNQKRKSNHDRRISLFQELLLSVKEIKGFHLFDTMQKRSNETVNLYVKWNNKLNVDKYNLKQFSLGLVDVFQFLCLILGIRFIMAGNMTVGVLTIIYSYYTKLNNLFVSIISLFESRISVNVAKLRIHKLFQYASKNYESNQENNRIEGTIEFEHILYGNKQSPILNDVSFIIPENSFNVITGLPDSGKSGIFDLLLGYNRQHVGSILIDQVNFNQYGKKQLSSLISAVDKTPVFFNMSIRDNLSIFDTNFENIISFAKEFGIHDYIMGLDLGYDTILQTDAANINNDVKYTLAIIRVLLKRTKIMLFDETFDYLSHDISEKVLKVLNEMKKENTIVVISKKKEVLELEFVDQLIVMSNHQVLLTGKHEELLKKSKEYVKIIQKL